VHPQSLDVPPPRVAREVKSSSRREDYHFDDIALQAFVLEGVGIAVSSIELLHVNTAYVRGPGGICRVDFFARVDVCDAVAAQLVDLPSRLPAQCQAAFKDGIEASLPQAKAAA